MNGPAVRFLAVTPQDLATLRTLEDPNLHPDGLRVAFVVSRMDLEEDRYDSAIWLWDGEEARPFSAGPGDRLPRWSPDGSRLAFLRKTDDEDAKPQVAILRLDGGEARTVTDFPLGAEDLAWGPDGTRLAVVGVDWTEDWSDLEDEERRRRPRRVTRIPWRADNRGWIHDRRRHLYMVDPEGEEDPRLLTPGDHDEVGPAWRPDGEAVAFLSPRHPGHGIEPGTQPWEVDLDTGQVRALAEVGGWSHVGYRPDGVIHLAGQPDEWAFPDIASVWRRDEDGSLTDLTGHLDRSVMFHSVAISPPGPRWVGEDFLIPLEDGGRVGVIRVDPDGKVDELVGGQRVVLGMDPTPGGTAVAFVSTRPTDPDELWWWEDGQERRLTELNAEFRESAGLIEPEVFRVGGESAELDVWVFLPPGEERAPLLLNIHGGPASQYGHRFFDEFQVYVGAGYGVVACNPRGSSGRGRDFLRAVVGEGWGSVDVADIDLVVEEALERFDRLDADRLGVMGGSYGGFLTAWLIGHQTRWRAAIVERGLLAWPSFGGTSDIGGYFSRMYLEADLPEGIETLYRQSPISVAHRVETPTLVLHSEKDFRCPIEQAEQYLMALRKAGVEAEMVRFPDESHELSRSGKPKHRVERFEIILDWLGRHLADDEVA